MPTYIVAGDVSDFMQRDAFGASTVPTATAVNGWIDQAEREIERRAGTAWKVTKVTDWEAMDYEYHDLGPAWSYFTYGLIHKPRIQLNHRDIVTPLATAQGDSLGLVYGGDYVEKVGVWVEGRGSDFWINATEGVLYINWGYPIIKFPDGVRIKYRYGRTVVDPWVKDITTKMVAIKVMEFDTKTMVAAGGPNNPEVLPVTNRIQVLADEVEKKLALEDINNYILKKPIIV